MNEGCRAFVLHGTVEAISRKRSSCRWISRGTLLTSPHPTPSFIFKPYPSVSVCVCVLKWPKKTGVLCSKVISLFINPSMVLGCFVFQSDTSFVFQSELKPCVPKWTKTCVPKWLSHPRTSVAGWIVFPSCCRQSREDSDQIYPVAPTRSHQSHGRSVNGC